MKILHISDLHIGAKLFNRDLSEDHEAVFADIIEKAKKEKPDVLVTAGDIYDKSVPSAEAVQVFNRFIENLTEALPDTEIMMLAGNHDSSVRLDLFRSILKKEKVHMVGEPPRHAGEKMCRVDLEDENGPVHFYLLPFVKPSSVLLLAEEEGLPAPSTYDEALKYLMDREEINTDERNVLVSHQFYLPDSQSSGSVERADSEVQTLGNIDRISASCLEPFDYSALGHIHKPMTVGSEKARYSGTPLQLSVSEAGQKKSMVKVDLKEKGNTEISLIDLKPKREIRLLKDTAANLIRNYPEYSNDYVSVVITDPEDIDMADAGDRLRKAFPRLLEIRRQIPERRETEEEFELTENRLDPIELCLDFAQNAGLQLKEEDRSILEEILNEVWEEEHETDPS